MGMYGNLQELCRATIISCCCVVDGCCTYRNHDSFYDALLMVAVPQRLSFLPALKLKPFIIQHALLHYIELYL